MATRMRALALTLAVALPISSCSDDSDEERAAAALKADMVANAGMTTGRAVDDGQTSCVADGMVAEIGVDRLQDYDLLTEDLSADESIHGVRLSAEDADSLAEVFAGCMDVERLMERQIIRDLDLPARQQRRAARCVRDGITTEQVTRTISLEFQGEPNPDFEQLRAELQSCLR
jgi:hypothetical protein